MNVPFHMLTDETPETSWLELPDGTVMRVGQWRAKVRVEAKRAKSAIEKARAERRQRRYTQEAEF